MNIPQSTTGVPATSFADTKRHYAILDGLRGVAAVMVVIFHVFETHAASRFEQIINHGYLAVDFFFVLSGFVIGYAYDDRWGKMSLKDFFKRRLIRLHPMIIMGMAIGAVLFYFQGSEGFPLINNTPWWQMLIVMVVGMTLIPLTPSMDIRGWSEMHPLNGPAWSLFFEYVANILYALFIRRFTNLALGVLVFIAGCATIHLAVTGTNGDVIGGWSFNTEQLHIGFVRLMYPFFAGLLLSRLIKPATINHGFIWCSLLLITVLSIPRLGNETTLWMNGIYDSAVIIVIFPIIVFIGASGKISGGIPQKICTFLGEISYPIYIIHYPLVYTYMAWVQNTKPTFAHAFPFAILTIAAALSLAYISLKIYDIPVRRWLTNRFAVQKK
ncbi:MAG: acyltransferase [Gammaproteobacteria bacterium]|nr:MAG: acyltransferase [Gammaproteobacteria bacterium]